MSRDKRAAFGELIDEVRRSQSATDRFDTAVADALGLNRTDMRCIDVLHRAGPMSAGELAEETGLSAGAMTAAIDRLERAGYAHRIRDTIDRRRVLVEATPNAIRSAEAFYREHAEQAMVLYDRYSVDEIELLLAFVRGGREFNERAAARLEDENRRRANQPGRDGRRRLQGHGRAE
jgi:DNA-binding MarR family transcriptional regulator